jgi:PAS domain S-box-containing protein
MDHSTMSEYMAHGFCFLWDPRLVWLHVVSDVLSGVAYISIAAAMAYYQFKRRDLPFPVLFGISAVFVVSCGATHLFGAYTVYVPLYWQEGYVKAFTALVSVIAAIMVIPVIPKALGLPSLPKALENIKRLNSELERQVEELRIKDYALASSVNGIVFTDLDGRLTYANNSFLDMWGYGSSEEVTGKSFTDFWESPAEAARVMESLKSGKERSGELTAKKEDGTAFPVFFNANTVFTSDGAPVSYMSSFADITDRKKAEVAFFASEKKYRDLLQSIHLVAVMLDVNGNITFCNEHLLRLTGWSRDAILGKNWFELFIPEDIRNSVKSVFISALQGGSIALHHDNHILTRDGGQLLISWDNVVLRNADGAVSGMASVGNDITEHRKLEEQLSQSQKMEAIGALAGGVAHDFNNILSAIIGYAHLLRMKMQPDDPLRLYVEQVLASSERATGLTQSLLAFSRKQVTDLKPVDMNSLIVAFQKMLHRLIGEDIEFTVNCFRDSLVVEADKGQLEQVLMNLVTNARDAMPRGGNLHIATDRLEITSQNMLAHNIAVPGVYAFISVTDNGMGMDRKTQARIFEPFFTTKEVGKGTGLGLAMVYGIIKKHNGFINVYSEPGQGTTFRIYLPLAQRAVGEIRREEGIAPPSGSETILLVEDDQTVRTVTRTALEAFGYTVIEAADGEEAVRIFRARKDEIQMVLCDVIMPKKNGKETLDELKKMRPDIKALFMSGYTSDIIMQKGILEEGFHFISKPLNPGDLLKKIRDVLKGSG